MGRAHKQGKQKLKIKVLPRIRKVQPLLKVRLSYRHHIVMVTDDSEFLHVFFVTRKQALSIKNNLHFLKTGCQELGLADERFSNKHLSPKQLPKSKFIYSPYPLHEQLERPLNLAAMSDLRSGVQSQTQEVLHLPGVFLNRFLKETSQENGRTKNWTKATTWNIVAQELPNRRTNSKRPTNG